ncbi:Dihydrofolate reductase [Paenibacillus sophorae]|uniref:Dihydrofolate reductase n=1 Tax=Paenibacillus sophorae TaxID=1333845 RepID=A0A1H8IXZ7_9BACL|nr:dihydrofolate reductase family protein [Paenibacillus sophorae]QWU16127.1 dihydrofolate reductase family protein [Paenibacillus sophorae]SEN73321.1 Dihydrofolate reductase [Paenibacillus sophorae]
MRKIVVFNNVSIDGYYAGPGGEIDWFIHDPEVDKAAHEMMSPDTVLFGRATYQMFESYWPHVAGNPNAPEGARMMANELNQMTKVVFSITLQEVNWENSRLLSGNLAEEARRLKEGEGADITVFGSGTIVQQLANEGLIDEYLLVLTPVVIGAGRPLFKDVNTMKLELLETRSFKSGVVLLHYGVSGSRQMKN